MTAEPAKDTKSDGVWLANTKAEKNTDNWLWEIAKDTMPTETWYNKDEAYTKNYNSILLAGENLKAGQQMVLFDSRALRHMSAYHDQFTIFEPITPKSITAIDRHTFEATEKKDVLIHISNGVS